MQFIQAQQQQIQNQQASMRNLETQIGQLANALNNRPPGRFPSDTQVPKIEERKKCKAIELRSGKELPAHHTEESTKLKQDSNSEKEKEEGWVQVEKPVFIPEPAKYVPKLPFPERQQKMRMN